MRAIAMRKIGSGPFKWSQMSPVEEGGGHEGHPDEWNFDKVSPKWAWMYLKNKTTVFALR